MTLQIEFGKYYRTRDGQKVGPMMSYDGSWHKWECNEGFAYGNNGGLYSTGKSSGHDIIAEWADDPAAREPETLDLAALAKMHGIKITVTIGEMSITYDGME